MLKSFPQPIDLILLVLSGLFTVGAMISAARPEAWWSASILYGIAASAFLSLWLLYRVPYEQTKHLRARLSKENEFEAENEARRTVATVLGGLALLASLYFTSVQFQEQRRQAADQLALAQAGQVTDRYIKAVQELGSLDEERATARIGAIFALARLARESRIDHAPIMALLASFVRERSARLERKADEPPPPATEEIRAAVSVLAERNLANEGNSLLRLNLSKANLRGIDLENGHLEYASFRGAYLYEANLQKAHLCGSDFSNAELSGANLSEADFRLTDLSGTSLTGYAFRMRSADAPFTTVKGANFSGARLELMEHLPIDLTNEFWSRIGKEAAVSMAGISPAAAQAATDLVIARGARVLLLRESPVQETGFDIKAVRQWEQDVDRAFPGEVRAASCAARGSAARLRSTS